MNIFMFSNAFDFIRIFTLADVFNGAFLENSFHIRVSHVMKLIEICDISHYIFEEKI